MVRYLPVSTRRIWVNPLCHFSFALIIGALFVSARRYDSNMLANSREELVEVFDALDAELDRLDEVSFEVLTTPERLAMLERLERLARRLPAVGHALINQLDAQAGARVDQPTRRPSRRGRTGRHAVLRAGQPVTHHQARRRPGHGLATPRRRPHRHRTRPQTRHHPGQPGIRRHVTAKWLPDPRSARHL